MWTETACVFSVLAGVNWSCRKRKRGGVINEYLISSSPAQCAVILIRSRGLEASSLWLPGTLAHHWHTWALPDLPVEKTSVGWIWWWWWWWYVSVCVRTVQVHVRVSDYLYLRFSCSKHLMRWKNTFFLCCAVNCYASFTTATESTRFWLAGRCLLILYVRTHLTQFNWPFK